MANIQSIALKLPCGDFGEAKFLVLDAAVEALAAQDADFYLAMSSRQAGLGAW